MQRSLVWKCLQVVARIFTTLLFNLKIHGRDNVPKAGGVLLVANHQSYLDPVLIAVRLTRPVSYMAKNELFANRYFGWFIRMLHAFPIRQGEGDVGAVKETIRRLQEGHMLNIYPEGSRTETGEIGPIEKGVALVIRKAGVPVVPVAIYGSFEAWPKGGKFFHPHPIQVMYGKPMRLEKLKGDEIVRRIDAALRQMFRELKTRAMPSVEIERDEKPTKEIPPSIQIPAIEPKPITVEETSIPAEKIAEPPPQMATSLETEADIDPRQVE